jgi:hypothetical protein
MRIAEQSLPRTGGVAGATANGGDPKPRQDPPGDGAEQGQKPAADPKAEGQADKDEGDPDEVD